MNKYKCDYCNREMNKGALVKHKPTCKRIYDNIDNIKTDYINGISVREIVKIYGVNKNNVYSILKKDGIKIRCASDASKASHIRYPNAHKHTDESKDKIRKSRIAWMKANPEKTAWRIRNEPSYPEKLFMKLCDQNLLYDKFDIVREYCVFPYYIDFAFINARVAIEIDGSQHWLDNTRIESDIQKDRVLEGNGWRIMRIPEFKLKDAFNEIELDVLNFLTDVTTSKKQYDVDIVAYETIRNDRKTKKEIELRLKRKKRDAKRTHLRETRYTDYCKVYPSWGWTVKLGNQWGISPQKAGTYCKKYFMLHDKGGQNVKGNRHNQQEHHYS